MPEVVQLKHVGAALRGAGNDLRRVDLHEVAVDQVLAEEKAHGAAQTDDRLVGGRAQVDPAVVQTRVRIHRDELAVLLGERVVGSDLGVRAHGGVQLEGQLHLHARDHEDLGDGNLHVLEGGGVDGSLHVLHRAIHVDDALLGDLAGVVHHRLGDVGRLEDAALNSIDMLTKDDEAALALVVHVERTTTNEHLLAYVLLNLVKTRNDRT